MAQAPIIETIVPAYSTDRLGERPVAIIAHGTAGKDSRAYLQSGGGRGVSIHVLIAKSGTIYRMVPDQRGANHAGAATSSFTLHGRTYTGGLVNRATLGFELENLQDGRDPYTEPQLLAMGWQIAHWRALWGALPVLRHGDLDPTRRRDPYQLSVNDIEQWVARADAHFNPPPVSLPTDPFAEWGEIGKPSGAAAGFAIPRAWLVNKRLGRCVQAETYSASGRYSVAEFEGGLVYYLKARNVALVELF